MATSNSGIAYQEYQEALNYPQVARRRMEVLPGGKIAPKSRLRKDKITITVVVAVLFAFAFGNLYLTAQIGLASQSISSLKAEIEQTENSTARAELEYGELNSLSRIEEYAITNLGMVYPENNTMYYLNQENSALIAQGTDGLTEQQPAAQSETATEADAAGNSLWRSLAMMLNQHFFNREDNTER